MFIFLPTLPTIFKKGHELKLFSFHEFSKNVTAATPYLEKFKEDDKASD